MCIRDRLTIVACSSIATLFSFDIVSQDSSLGHDKGFRADDRSVVINSAVYTKASFAQGLKRIFRKEKNRIGWNITCKCKKYYIFKPPKTKL